MDITVSKVSGNTWCIEMPNVMIPYYRLNTHEIILFDSGCSRKGVLGEWLKNMIESACYPGIPITIGIMYQRRTGTRFDRVRCKNSVCRKSRQR